MKLAKTPEERFVNELNETLIRHNEGCWFVAYNEERQPIQNKEHIEQLEKAYVEWQEPKAPEPQNKLIAYIIIDNDIQYEIPCSRIESLNNATLIFGKPENDWDTTIGYEILLASIPSSKTVILNRKFNKLK